MYYVAGTTTRSLVGSISLGEKVENSNLCKNKVPKIKQTNNQIKLENEYFKRILTHCVLLCRNYNSELVAFVARLGEKFDNSELRESKT